MDAVSHLRAVELLEAYGFSTPSNQPYMTTITTVLKDGVFIPYGEHDYDEVRALTNGNSYRMKIVNDRNGKLLNKYHKMIDVVYDNLSELQQSVYYNSRDRFRHGVEMAAGCVEPVYDLRTNQIVECRTSVSYDSMSEKEFQDLFERVKTVLVEKVLRKCEDEEYKDMIRNF